MREQAARPTKTLSFNKRSLRRVILEQREESRRTIKVGQLLQILREPPKLILRFGEPLPSLRSRMTGAR